MPQLMQTLPVYILAMVMRIKLPHGNTNAQMANAHSAKTSCCLSEQHVATLLIQLCYLISAQQPFATNPRCTAHTADTTTADPTSIMLPLHLSNTSIKPQCFHYTSIILPLLYLDHFLLIDHRIPDPLC